jgi:hypothetical protein
LNAAGASPRTSPPDGTQGREQHTKIQVVRENNPAVGCGEIEDLGIGNPRRADT